MNANELAEILESDSKHTSGRFTYSSRYIADIATMLRTIPELLEALINLLKACNNADVHGELSEFIDGSLLGDAEEAIAKARGEQA